MRIYLDACCLNRLTDDQSQSRIREEAAAVEGILRLVHAHEAIWVSSSVLLIEIGRNPDTERLRDVTALCAFANEMVTAGPAIAQRAIELAAALGFVRSMLCIWPAPRRAKRPFFLRPTTLCCGARAGSAKGFTWRWITRYPDIGGASRGLS